MAQFPGKVAIEKQDCPKGIPASQVANASCGIVSYAGGAPGAAAPNPSSRQIIGREPEPCPLTTGENTRP
jgi:hypothetical protein